ncbi:MAG: gliding motility-associated C-terminal domain-containing protein [Saprospiraceae bacterium]
MILFLGIHLLSTSLAAQIIPPEFICVKSDTLIWEVPTNTCGDFNSYEIFFSQNENGPYDVLATINDPNQTNFVHEESITGAFFYYFQTNADCPGEMSLSSDTLDNRLPEVIDIRSVSVENNAVVISWNINPDAAEYIIYQDTEMGIVPIGTTSDLSYTDSENDPSIATQTYYVTASDACRNTSIFPDSQTSILLSTEGGNSCDRTINLSWNRYVNWRNPIERQEIWVSINNSVAEKIDSVAGDVTTYGFTNINNATDYCFFIKAIESETGYSANSSESCLTANITEGNDELFLRTVSFTPDNQVQLDWLWNTNATLTEINILRGSEINDLSPLEMQSPVTPLPNAPSFTDESEEASNAAFYYQISTTDECSTTVNSDVLNTVLLAGMVQPDQTNLLTWTIPDWNGSEIERYELFRIINGETEDLGVIRPPVNSYSDPIDPNNLAQANAQYYLLISIIIKRADGTLETVQVRSNTISIVQFANIQTPNAFAPNGRNRIFRPVITFGESADYQLIIYNRYGGIVFETTDFQQGWNGRDISGKLSTSGVYIYHIRIVQPDGSTTEDTGTVTLIR